MRIELENGKVVPLFNVLEACLRSSLEPIPVSFECIIRVDVQDLETLQEGKIIKAGLYQTPFQIVYTENTLSPLPRMGNNKVNSNIMLTRKVIALHENSCQIAKPLNRAVIKENANLTDIYRACGGKSQINKAFTVPRFYSYRGQVPSHQIALVCQEQGGVVRWLAEKNQLAFTRIYDLFKEENIIDKRTYVIARTQKSQLIQQHEIPQYITIKNDGGILKSESGKGSSVKFTPKKTSSQLNFMRDVLLNALQIEIDLNLKINAGDGIMLGEEGNMRTFIVITAAHAVQQNLTGTSENKTVLWLGKRHEKGN